MTEIQSGGSTLQVKQILSDSTPFAGANIDAKISSIAVAASQPQIAQPQLTLPIKAAMDDTTLVGTIKSGNDYLLSNNYTVGGTGRSDAGGSGEITATKIVAALTESIVTLLAYIPSPAGNSRAAIYTDNSGTPLTLLNESGSQVSVSGFNSYTIPSTALTGGTTYWIAINQDSGFNLAALAGTPGTNTRAFKAWAYGAFQATLSGITLDNIVPFMGYVSSITTGTIKSNSIAKNTNIGLRYWGSINWNLVAGAALSTVAIKICDSSGNPLHTNFVTIDPSEFARFPLLRPVVLTAGSNGQTTWNLTTLGSGSNSGDALINELGVLAEAVLVELATNGSTYTTLIRTNDPTSIAVGQFYEDITNSIAPQIKTNGTGIVISTSKLRVSYIVNIALSNTTIKLQIQLNRNASGDTSPSIQLLADNSNYVQAGQVAIV